MKVGYSISLVFLAVNGAATFAPASRRASLVPRFKGSSSLVSGTALFEVRVRSFVRHYTSEFTHGS